MSSTAAATDDAEEARSLRRKAISIGMVTYLRLAWPDYLTLLIICALTFGIYCAPLYRLSSRLVPVWPSVLSASVADAQGNLRIPNELAYPDLGEPLSSRACGVIVLFFPSLTIAIFQIKIRSLWDFHAGVVGFLKAVLLTSFVTTTLKHFIGGPRPNFFALCKPDWTSVLNGHAWIFPDQTHGAYYNVSLCQGNQLAKALQGFPSGHTSSAFAAATFLSLYMNAKLKAFADYASEFWVVIITILPLILASLIAGSQYTSYQHHAHEIFAGMLLGILIALLVYRSAYAAVFDFHYNHIPLPPFGARTRFTYSLNSPHLSTKTVNLDSEDDHLVVWNWWKQSGIGDKDEAKELSWLKSIRSVEATGQEMAPILKGLRQRRKAKAKAKMDTSDNDLECNRARATKARCVIAPDMGFPGQEPSCTQRETVEIGVFELAREPMRVPEVQEEVMCYAMRGGLGNGMAVQSMEPNKVCAEGLTSDRSRVQVNEEGLSEKR